MNKKIQSLFVEREDIKQEFSSLLLEIKGVADESGLFTEKQKNELESSMQSGGMGAMMQLPQMFGKLASLKAAIPAAKQAFGLLMRINDINEQIQNELIFDMYTRKGA